MTHAVLITDSGFSKDDWTSAIAFGPDAAHSIEVEAIDIPLNSAPEHIFMPPHPVSYTHLTLPTIYSV